MLVHFTSFALCGANLAMPFWEQNWGWEREGISEAAEKHVSISSTCGKGKSSRDLLLFGCCNLLLSCGEKWNLGGYLKCLFHRIWLHSGNVTISCPLQTLVRGGTASLVCASVWYISLRKIQILYTQQGAGKSCRHSLYTSGRFSCLGVQFPEQVLEAYTWVALMSRRAQHLLQLVSFLACKFCQTQ